MKKIQVVALAAIIAMGALFTSCGDKVNTHVTLKTEADTLSYVYGAGFYDQFLKTRLQQMGLVTDTALIRMEYMGKIQMEADPTKKTELEKQMKHKLDSTSKANKKNMSEFLKGFEEGIDSNESKSAYIEGLALGSQMSKQFKNISDQIYGPDSKEKINKNVFMAGLYTGVKDEKYMIENPGDVFQEKMQMAQVRAQERQAEELKKQFEPQIKAGEQFLAENKTKEGVVTLPSGLQYKVITEGKGEKPSATDVVKVNYRGTLIDGTEFDSSYSRNEPFVFTVNQMVKGWVEALPMMPVGSKWMLYVPYNLAYGAEERGDKIKPFSTLIFEVDLLDIQKQPTAAK